MYRRVFLSLNGTEEGRKQAGRKGEWLREGEWLRDGEWFRNGEWTSKGK